MISPAELEFGVRFVETAGVDILHAQRGGSFEVSTKPDGTSVTTIDTAINERLIREVQDRFPSHGVVGEEASLPSDGGEHWVIDPVDGTRGFIEGEAEYSLSLAFVRGGVTLLGLVFAPAINRMYSADRASRRALMNSQDIEVGQHHSFYEAPYTAISWAAANPSLDYFRAQTGQFPGHNNRVHMRSVALQFCRVADGRLGFAVFPGPSAHDIAAGALIVQCAGGEATDLRGNLINPIGTDNFGALASNGNLHQPVLDEIDRFCLGGLQKIGRPA